MQRRFAVLGGVLIIFLMVSAVGVRADSLSTSATVNTYPEAKPNETAVVLIEIQNTGYVSANYTLRVEAPEDVFVHVSPDKFTNVAPLKKVVSALYLRSNMIGSHSIKLFIDAVAVQAGNITLSQTLLFTIRFTVDLKAQTTNELQGTYEKANSNEVVHNDFIMRIFGTIAVIIVLVVFFLFFWYKKENQAGVE